jgi:hypothetical protein
MYGMVVWYGMVWYGMVPPPYCMLYKELHVGRTYAAVTRRSLLLRRLPRRCGRMERMTEKARKSHVHTLPLVVLHHTGYGKDIHL